MMRLSEDLRTVTNPDGGVALDIRKGLMFRLNTTGALIFEVLVGGATEEQIAAEVSKRCSVDIAVASADVKAFLSTLRKHSLLAGDDQR